MKPFPVGSVTANIVKFVPDERNNEACVVVNDDPNIYKSRSQKSDKPFEYAEVEKPSQSPASTERVRSTSSESKSKSDKKQ